MRRCFAGSPFPSRWRPHSSGAAAPRPATPRTPHHGRLLQRCRPQPATPGCTPALAHASGDSNGHARVRRSRAHVHPARPGPLRRLDADTARARVPRIHAERRLHERIRESPAGGRRRRLHRADPRTARASRSSGNSTASGSGPDDAGFVRDLLAKVESELCVDTARVYAAGYSNGGGMAQFRGVPARTADCRGRGRGFRRTAICLLTVPARGVPRDRRPRCLPFDGSDTNLGSRGRKPAAGAQSAVRLGSARLWMRPPPYDSASNAERRAIDFP